MGSSSRPTAVFFLLCVACAGICQAGTELTDLLEQDSGVTTNSRAEPPTNPIELVLDGEVIDITTRGTVEGDSSLDACNKNTETINAIIQDELKPGCTLLIPAGKTFWFNGGIRGQGLRNVKFQIDGIMKFQNERKHWPTNDDNDNVKECIYFEDVQNVVWTSTQRENGGGLIDGRGAKWWGYINYYIHSENRPRLFHVYNSNKLLVENLFFKDSPYWTFWANDVADLVVRYSKIDVRRSKSKTHDLYNMGAFNTDGFDVAGRNVHIHDCDVWNDDDTVCVKEMNGNSKQGSCSENMLFERINASGVGLTIGSIGASKEHTCVRNITFRDIKMQNPFKGIYVKSRPASDGETGEISDVLYENIEINNPNQWGIWIGPQQAIYKNACSLFWPFTPGSKCPVPPQVSFSKITLKNVTINNPKLSPGIILGNSDNPMQDIVFDNVKVNKPGLLPFWRKYKCENTVRGIAKGGTHPVPPCFTEEK